MKRYNKRVYMRMTVWSDHNIDQLIDNLNYELTEKHIFNECEIDEIRIEVIDEIRLVRKDKS